MCNMFIVIKHADINGLVIPYIDAAFSGQIQLDFMGDLDAKLVGSRWLNWWLGKAAYPLVI